MNRRNPSRPIAASLFACFFMYLAGAGTLYADFIDPSPEVSAFATLPDPLSAEALSEIAVAFSGVTPSFRAGYVDQILAIISDVKDRVEPGLDTYALGEYILEYLHEHIFRRYVEVQTRIDVVLDSGTYNCVSSSVLYFIVARAFSLPVLGTATPDHAFCSMYIDSRLIDIETTSKYGFDPGRKKEFHDEFGNLTGFSYVPPTNHRGRSETDERSLVSLILHNRISEADARRNYVLAVTLAADRHAFLRSDESLDDFDREIGNYIAMLNISREYEGALELLERYFARYGAREQLIATYRGVSHNHILTLLNARRYDDARLALASRRATSLVDSHTLIELETTAVRHELYNVLPTLEVDAAFALLQAIRETSVVPESTYREFLVSLHLRLADQVAVESDFYAAAMSIDRAIEELGNDANLVRAKNAYTYNYTVETHNRFAEAYNAGEYQRALHMTEEALLRVPDSDILKNDLRTVRETIASRKAE